MSDESLLALQTGNSKDERIVQCSLVSCVCTFKEHTCEGRIPFGNLVGVDCQVTKGRIILKFVAQV